MNKVYYEERGTIWATFVELNSKYIEQDAPLLNIHIPVPVDYKEEQNDRGDYNHVCDLIIKEIKKIRALPNKLTFEYIQFFKRVPGSEMLKEIKPPKGKEVKPLRDLVSEDATVYFELLPFKLDRISNGKIVNYEVYDELDNQLLKTY